MLKPKYSAFTGMIQVLQKFQKGNESFVNGKEILDYEKKKIESRFKNHEMLSRFLLLISVLLLLIWLLLLINESYSLWYECSLFWDTPCLSCKHSNKLCPEHYLWSKKSNLSVHASTPITNVQKKIWDQIKNNLYVHGSTLANKLCPEDNLWSSNEKFVSNCFWVSTDFHHCFLGFRCQNGPREEKLEMMCLILPRGSITNCIQGCCFYFSNHFMMYFNLHSINNLIKW